MYTLILILGMVLASSPVQAEPESWKTLNTAGMLAYKERNFAMAQEMFHRAPRPRGSNNSIRDVRLNNLGAPTTLGEYEQANSGIVMLSQ